VLFLRKLREGDRPRFITSPVGPIGLTKLPDLLRCAFSLALRKKSQTKKMKEKLHDHREHNLYTQLTLDSPSGPEEQDDRQSSKVMYLTFSFRT